MTATIPTSEHTAREATASERFAALPVDLQNALTAQRDDVTAAINNANTLEALKAAERAFWMVAHVWHVVGYGYKCPEVRARIVRRAADMAREQRSYAATLPNRAMYNPQRTAARCHDHRPPHNAGPHARRGRRNRCVQGYGGRRSRVGVAGVVCLPGKRRRVRRVPARQLAHLRRQAGAAHRALYVRMSRQRVGANRVPAYRRAVGTEATGEAMNRPTPMLDVFARVARGRVSNLRGLAAVAAGLASCVGPWPFVAWRCYRLGAWYTRHVLVSLLSAPVLLWALHLRGFNSRVELFAPDPAGPKWRTFPKPGSPAWGAMNRERAALIFKGITGELTDAERARLDYLQTESEKALRDG